MIVDRVFSTLFSKNPLLQRLDHILWFVANKRVSELQHDPA